MILKINRVCVLKYLADLARLLPHRVQKLIPGKHFLFDIVSNWNIGQGLHKIKNAKGNFYYLYTNRGLATHPPLRLFCDPEITLFELETSTNSNFIEISKFE